LGLDNARVYTYAILATSLLTVKVSRELTRENNFMIDITFDKRIQYL